MDMLPDIWFMGDPHGTFDTLKMALDNHPAPEALVLLGDMTVTRPLDEVLSFVPSGVDIHFIHGNHDCDEIVFYENLFDSKWGNKNLHRKVVEIAGIKIAGLGGVFRQKTWYPKEHDSEPAKCQSFAEMTKKTPKHQRYRGGPLLKNYASIYPEDVECLKSQKADVLVTHEAPSTHQHGFVGLDQLAQAMGVKVVFHGHQHLDYRSQLATGVRVEGLGLGSIRSLNGSEVVIAGKTGS